MTPKYIYMVTAPFEAERRVATLLLSDLS